MVIKKIKEGYRVIAKSGRNMGTYKSKSKASKRLKQIEQFSKSKNK